MHLVFIDDEHRQFFSGLVSGDKKTDCIFYLFGADESLREHADALYGENGDVIADAITAPWISKIGQQLLRLADSLCHGTSVPLSIWTDVPDTVAEVMYEAIDIWRGAGGYDSNMVLSGWISE